jgi:hypothetical protein
MTKTAVTFIALLTALLPYPIRALDPVAKIVDQPDSPLKIILYNAAYQEGGRYSTEGIHHAVEYQNISGRIVEAVQIGLVSFDVWNDYLDRTGGLPLDVLALNAKDKGTWVTGRYRGSSFLTGVAYVSKVRFNDGEIWEADLQSIADELAKIEEGFDVSRLTEREDEE